MFILRIIEVVLKSIFTNGNATVVSYEVRETKVKSEPEGSSVCVTTVAEVDVLFDD